MEGSGEVRRDPKDEEAVTLTLPRGQWKCILFLALRGGKEALEHFVRGMSHDPDCMAAHTQAVKALHDLLYPDQANPLPQDMGDQESVH
jgi:hypothetical protein